MLPPDMGAAPSFRKAKGSAALQNIALDGDVTVANPD
jgi:hypothetical protein